MFEPRDDANPGGRPPVLDEQKRRIIIALLANGSSRRMAAHYVRCSPATLVRTMDRDPDFAAAVAQAEESTEIDALRRIRNASRNERYWRAAAWLLERRNPQEFAQRPPRAFTDEQIVRLFRLAVDPFVEKMSDKDFDEMMERLEARMAEVRTDPRLGTSPKFPFPSAAADPFATREPARLPPTGECDDPESAEGGSFATTGLFN